MIRRFILLSLLLFSVSQSFAGETIKILAEDDWYPYSAVINGKAEGFAVDIVKAAYQAVGVEATFEALPFARCLHLVKAGKEIGCFDTVKDATNMEIYNFHTTPLFVAKMGIYAQASYTGTANVKTLEGKKVGVTNGYTYGDSVDKNSNIILEKVSQDVLSLKKLAKGRIDFAIAYTRVADYLIGTNKADLMNKLKLVGTISDDQLFISFSKTHPKSASSMALLEKGLGMIKANGTYKKIKNEWDVKLNK